MNYCVALFIRSSSILYAQPKLRIFIECHNICVTTNAKEKIQLLEKTMVFLNHDTCYTSMVKIKEFQLLVDYFRITGKLDGQQFSYFDHINIFLEIIQWHQYEKKNGFFLVNYCSENLRMI